MNDSATRPEPSRENAIASPVALSVEIVSGAAGGKMPHEKIAEIQVLAVERRASLGDSAR